MKPDRRYSNQAAALEAADTRDPDGDGVYCESPPCPCSKPGSGGGGDGGDDGAAEATAREGAC